MRLFLVRLLLLSLVPATSAARAQQPEDPSRMARERFEKREVAIPMRDGAKLFTAVYVPKDAGKEGAPSCPILLCRTPYSVAPYGEGKYKETVGPSALFTDGRWIVAYQDVRGCWMSEGAFVNVRPHLESKPDRAKDEAAWRAAIDESTDTWDTIDWLVANVPGNNGKVGLWGISYPGFYAAAGMIDHHPALAAVSPQAPIADWYFDDFHHHGALFLPHAFNFMAGFGRPRPEPTSERRGARFDHGTRDGYAFFLGVGPLWKANERWFGGQVAYWDELVAHPDRDAYWQARDLQPRLKNVAPAVMTVGGWFDAEDLYGALHVYSAVEERNPGVFNVLVMGPWAHGGWSRSDGDRLGIARFGSKTAEHYRKEIELAFFERFLNGEPGRELAEATVFETGTNRWRTFTAWPPAEAEEAGLYVREGGRLAFEAPLDLGSAFDEYVSDPARPVPFTEAVAIGMTREYMTDDQRFAARRPDVLVYQTESIFEPVTFAGPILAELWVSTSGTDSDWIVKLIDVFPDDAPSPEDLPAGRSMSGCQMMVRSEVIRGRYREDYARPRPFVPDEPTYVDLPLQDVLHTFGKGHRIMVQIQSTWFPLVDRNPQKFVPNVFAAGEGDYAKATQRVHRSKGRATRLRVSLLR